MSTESNNNAKRFYKSLVQRERFTDQDWADARQIFQDQDFDIDISSAKNNQTLIYNEETNRWTNKLPDIGFPTVKEYKVFNEGATTYVTDLNRRVINSSTDTQAAVQWVIDGMLHGQWFVFYWDSQRFTLLRPILFPKSVSFTTLKAITMKGYRAFRSSGAISIGTQFVYDAAFPTQRYAFEAEQTQQAPVNEYYVLDLDGFSFDNRSYGKSWQNGALNKNLLGGSTIIDAGAIKIRNSDGYAINGISVKNIHTMFVWRALHLEGAVVMAMFENFTTEDDTGSHTAPGSFVGDNLIQLNSLAVPTFFNPTVKYCLFKNFKRFGQGRYKNWLRMQCGNYNTFIDIFPDGGYFEETVFNLDNTQDVLIDSGNILSGNAFYHLQTLDTQFSGTDNRKGGTLYLSGTGCVGNNFRDCLLTAYPKMVRIAGGAACNTIEIDPFVVVNAQIDDTDAGIGNTIVARGGFKIGGHAAPVTLTGSLVTRIIDMRPGAEKAGAATGLADGGTINHGLFATPLWATVQATVAGEMASVTAVSATNLTIALKKHDNTAGTSQTVYWRAGVYA